MTDASTHHHEVDELIIGCGYLGRRVAERWLADGHRVAALTRSADHAEQMRSAGIHPVLGDVTEPDSLANLPAASTVLYAVGFDRSSGKSQREIYVDGLQNVLTALNSRIRRFIYISSTSVYGQSDGEWIDEDSVCRPERANGQACLDAEQVVWDHFSGKESDQTANVLRLAGIYGPGRLLRRIEQIRSGEQLAGNPEGYLNLIHVNDAVQAVLACQQRGNAGTTYLVSDDRPVRRREYYELLASLVGAPAPRFEIQEDERRSASSLGKRCSNGRIRQQLAVELRYPTITEGLAQAIRPSADS